jgi:hypothetical protein
MYLEQNRQYWYLSIGTTHLNNFSGFPGYFGDAQLNRTADDMVWYVQWQKSIVSGKKSEVLWSSGIRRYYTMSTAVQFVWSSQKHTFFNRICAEMLFQCWNISTSGFVRDSPRYWCWPKVGRVLVGSTWLVNPENMGITAESVFIAQQYPDI